MVNFQGVEMVTHSFADEFAGKLAAASDHNNSRNEYVSLMSAKMLSQYFVTQFGDVPDAFERSRKRRIKDN